MHLLKFDLSINNKRLILYSMKPTCIAYTNTYLYNFHLCGFHQAIKTKMI